MQENMRTGGEGETNQSPGWPAEVDNAAARVTSADLIEELGEAGDEILAAIKTGDESTVGAVVLAIHRAYVERVASFAFVDLGRMPQAAEAARKALALVRDQYARAAA